MSITPVNPAAPVASRSNPPEESERWKTLLDALLPQRPIELAKQSDMVRLTRSYEPDEGGKGATIWTKTYQKSRRGEAGRIDLSVFNAWECTLIVKAHEDGLESCYRLYQLYEKGTGIHVGDTPLEMRKSRSTVIKTHHAGSDLDLWSLMRPWSKGGRLDHPFVQQQHFLKLIRGILFALHGFHSKRFVHCDLHPGNIVLPAEVRMLPAAHGEGERYELRALWDQVRLIDLGYSIHKGIEPPAMLPLALWELTDDQKHPRRDGSGQKIASRRMSPHLHGRLKTLDAIASSWSESERYSRSKWEAQQDQLNILQSLDWREDLYQLGYWLTRIRDGDEDGCWGAVHYMGDPVDRREVNAFIRDFPQQLMDWGQAGSLPAEMPHIDYISRIDALLKLLPVLPDSFVLHRRDHDSAYKTYLEVSALGHASSGGIAHRESGVGNAGAGPPEQALAPDQSAWNHVCLLDNAAAYAYYLREWPQGAWVAEARARQQQCLTQEAQAHRRAPARRTTGRGALATMLGLTAMFVAAWYGWPTQRAAEPAARAGVSTPAPAAAKASQSVAPEVAAHVDAPVAAPTAALPHAQAVDDDARRAAYLARTVLVENSDWWLKGRSLGLAANAEQIAWVHETVTHAEQDRWPRAQFALAGLYCSGAYPQAVPLSARKCGEWRAAALANPLLKSPLTAVEERNNMVHVVVTEFDDMVLGFWQGRYHHAPPQRDFANALLAGMQALQAEYPGLALRVAHVLACTLEPVQRVAANQTLLALVRRHPGSQEATLAARWLSEWRVGNYRRCHRNGA
jgi:serine/threonine protein kinase